MRRVLVILMISMESVVAMSAQDNSGIEAIMALTGAEELEDADQYEVERLNSLLERPLKINQATSSKLVSSGLFTQYQAASILDYRKRHGDIMSFAELALVDGFNEGFIRIVMPFIDLSSRNISLHDPGQTDHELHLRSGYRKSEEATWNYAVKYEADTYSGFAAGLAASRSTSAESGFPDSFSVNLEYESVKVPLRIIAGDYNARFGQGLALWNGMSMSGLSSPSTFLRRSSGFSRSSSFTGNYAMSGLAACIYQDNLVFNAAVAFPGVKSVRSKPDNLTVLPVMNITWNRRHGQMGLTHYLDFKDVVNDMKTSFDMAWCLDGTDIFAEIAYDWKGSVPAGLAGVTFPMGESYRGAAMVRSYPATYDSERSGAQRSTTGCSNEYSMTLAAEYLGPDRSHTGNMSLDMAYFPESKTNTPGGDHQVKISASWQWTAEKIKVKAMVNERIRSWGQPSRTDLRADISFPLGVLALNLRSNFLYCKSFAALFYAETAYVEEVLSAYVRAGVFRSDNWDDRIYVYERDAPGSFNVPAMYGRGIWGAATVTLKLTRTFKLYGRASFTSYPFMEKKKPGKAELKLQCALSF